MTSSNINKIAQTNFNLKPWVLSKNTSEIVKTCIQQMYKQMPNSFRRDLKPVKVAAARPENPGPLRDFINQERQLSKCKKHSRTTTLHPVDNSLLKSLKSNNLENLKVANKFAGAALTSNKKLLKSANYKIYKSRRFGSSASSSRSSLFRRYDERRRQRQNCPTQQVNYLVRSFHSNQLEGTYAKYLMPIRNQQVDARLSCIKDAAQINADIQRDLMSIEYPKHSRVLKNVNKAVSNFKITPREDKLKSWKHPPSLDLYHEKESRSQICKKNKSTATKRSKLPRWSPEQRNYTRSNGNSIVPLKHPMPPNELFTAKHDRKGTELHEKHRRNRLRNLGLVQQFPASSGKANTPLQARQLEQLSATVSAAAAAESTVQSYLNNYSFQTKWTPNILSHLEANAAVTNINHVKSNSLKYRTKLPKMDLQHQNDKQQYKLSTPNSIQKTNPGLAKKESILLNNNTKDLSSYANVKDSSTSADSQLSQALRKPTRRFLPKTAKTLDKRQYQPAVISFPTAKAGLTLGKTPTTGPAATLRAHLTHHGASQLCEDVFKPSFKTRQHFQTTSPTTATRTHIKGCIDPHEEMQNSAAGVNFGYNSIAPAAVIRREMMKNRSEFTKL